MGELASRLPLRCGITAAALLHFLLPTIIIMFGKYVFNFILDSYFNPGFADTGNKQNQYIDFNPWNVVMFLSSCFAQKDQRKTIIAAGFFLLYFNFKVVELSTLLLRFCAKQFDLSFTTFQGLKSIYWFCLFPVSAKPGLKYKPN